MDQREWETIRDRIIDLEAIATEHTNAARDALIEQGDLFNRVAPKGDKRGPNGTGVELERMAAECGIAPNTARHRRDAAADLPSGGQIRSLLQGASDVLISFGTLRTILADDQPEVLLERLIADARSAETGRITRDEARRARGNITGTVGTPQATAERMARDPDFRRAVAGAMTEDQRDEVADEFLAPLAAETSAAIKRDQERPVPAETRDPGMYHLKAMALLHEVYVHAGEEGYWTRSRAVETLNASRKGVDQMLTDLEFDGITEPVR